ncbi:FAD-binding oxidoreductase [Sphingopyxis sp.]|uniref:NAD(P)/FAD-dependent oxidoreductase n=1 Tax=Sphingopyxis sp. TaxID=1908224 RepID=UPI002EDABCA0
MGGQCDIVVIGAGIAGASVAAELSSDYKVLLVEQEARPGMHTTGRSAALHSEVYGNEAVRALTRASRDFSLGGRDGRIFARPRGCLHLATFEQCGRLARLSGEPGMAGAAELVEGAALRARIPLLRDNCAAALDERHAYDLDVDAIHQYYLAMLRANGGVLRASSRVETIEAMGGGWTLVAGGAEIRAGVIVNAAGAWGDEVACLAGVEPLGLQARRRTAIVVDAPEGVDVSGWPAVIDVDERYYFKPEGGRILMSPADETPSLPCDAFAEELDIALAIDRVQEVADIPVRRVPHSWAGLRTFAPDRTPVAGFDAAAPGFFWLVGQGGYGIQTAPALARMAAALVRGTPLPEDIAAHGVDPATCAPGRLRRAADTDQHQAAVVAAAGL